jgi:tRNA (cmo5U34)-methyltransferase
MPNKDNLFSEPLDQIAPFRFDQSVVDVFPDMIKRSVPGYPTIIAMTGVLAARYAQPNTHLYDLGCSLGASILSMRQQPLPDGCKIIGIDNSPSMIKRCQSVLDTDSNTTPVELSCADISNAEYENASVIVLNFTLQFLRPEGRDALIQKLVASLCPGGILVISEKVEFTEPTLDQLNIELHHEFKRRNGYSDLEVAQKRSAIENVLIRDSIETHRKRLLNGGCDSANVWFQCFNFASIVALKA